MASQSGFPRSSSHPRPYFAPHAPMHSSESGHLYQSSRGIGLPSMDYPPQPVEIERSNSRTLPSPAASAVSHWDLPQHGFGEVSASYNSNPSRNFHIESQSRASNQAPLLQWYTENDGPWVPKGVIPEERNSSRPRISNRMSLNYGHQYRQPNSTDSGTYHFGAPHSDSGYGSNGARRSDGNASIFSADLTDKDQDSHSISGPTTDFPPYQGINEVLQSNVPPTGPTWNTLPSSAPLESTAGLICPTCQKPVKTRSELKKHDLRHTKPFHCTYPGCTRAEGFSTTNDLDRHTKSKHPTALQGKESTKRYRCRYPGCKSSEKSWPRLDNFKSHLKRVHHLRKDEDCDKMLRDAEINPLDQERPPSQQSVSPEAHPHPMEPELNSSYMPISRPVYPDVISVDVTNPKLSTPKGDTSNYAPLEARDTPSDSPLATVQPVEVFPAQPEILDRPLALVNILAPVSLDVPEQKSKESCSPSLTATTRPRSEGKATKQELSASDAKLTEAIKIALVGTKSPTDINDRGPRHNMERNHDPAGNFPPNSSWSAEPTTATTHARMNTAGPLLLKDDDRDLEAKAKDVLKSLRDLGYIIQEPSPPKPLNPGSAASIKSENQVICQSCFKFKGRPCELKKHMKRHSRPYGCTFATCNKTFGSKNDWKRHENSQHFHLETWRCNEEKLEGGICAKAYYRRQTFQDHLKKDHSITTDAAVKNKLEGCRIGRNCQARFWCGFCTKLIDLTKKGIDAWTERFDHIDDHFMGRYDQPKLDIRDWVPVDSNKPRGDLPHSLNTSPDHEVHEASSPASSSSGSEPESSDVAGESAHARNPDSHAEPLKRKHSESNEDSRKAKKPMNAYRGDTIVYCCQCGASHNPKFDQSCNMCSDSHKFCQNCAHEKAPVKLN